MDMEARLYRRETLYCPECRRRIAWTTIERAFRDTATAWRWQGKGVPIRYRIDGDVPRVDLKCFSCGWTDSPPVTDVPFATSVLMASDILAQNLRRAEQMYAEAP